MESPIPLDVIENIDVLVKLKDGTIELKVICARHLDASEETQKRLIQKLNNYLLIIHDEEFQEEFGDPGKERVCFCITCIDEPAEEMKELISSIRPQVEEGGASLVWKISK